MQIWILSRIGHILVLFTGRDDISEFDIAEVDLFSKFNPIVGYRDIFDFDVSVVGREGTFYYDWLNPMETHRCADDIEFQNYKSYLRGDSINIFDPHLVVRFGVYAVVSDRGRLLYLDMLNKKRLVLSDICTSLAPCCLRGGGYTLVFDDEIQDIHYNFCMGCMDIICDVSRLSLWSMLKLLEWAASNYSIRLER